MLWKSTRISNETAVGFLQESKAYKEQIAISAAGAWLGIYDTDRLAGVIGITETKHAARIKGFYVSKEYRGQGIGTQLLRDALDITDRDTITAFATRSSKPIFEAKEFISENTNKHGITFMRRNNYGI